ncbi:LIM domain-containing protein WLIM2a [Striga hermonthica]|uniref:LIM domain-containing protein WLIM2a n=1 Tax=Striga hermonthica TaxID=68872 RepID=A0A9N7NJQ2_STRHE|nr:LIM domain-containing protein WLIM2a [Striga hermonthica]
MVWPMIVDGARWVLGNGMRIRFWRDPWLGSAGPLIRFVHNHVYIDNIFSTVAEHVDACGNWEWHRFHGILPSTLVPRIAGTLPLKETAEDDRITWGFSEDGQFATRSLGGPDIDREHLDYLLRLLTKQKCKACEKTVYPVELLSADGISYHKSCFKCSHCKGTLKLSSYSSMEGVLYCKPHYEQLFKETGSFSKNFHSLHKVPFKFLLFLSVKCQTRSPSKAASMFSGTQDKCATCGKTAYPLEKVTVESQSYHKSCFKCSHGGCSLTPSNYAALDGILYCKPHFSQLFKEKGSYNHLIKSASMKRPTAAAVPDS